MFESHAELIDSDMSQIQVSNDNVETFATRNINIVVYFMLYFWGSRASHASIMPGVL